MARIPSEREVEWNLSDDAAKYDVSEYVNTHYRYNFPYDLGSGKDRTYGVYDMYVGQSGAPFVTVNSSRLLSKKDAYFKLSISFALFSLFEKTGFSPRPVGAIGGYNNDVTNEAYTETKHKVGVQEYIVGLNDAKSPFQVQSRFTLSRAHSIMANPESAIIEFFKIIELFIKHNAHEGNMSKDAYNDVFGERHAIFSTNVKTSLKTSILDSETVDTIWKLKDVRNKFVGHGGIRPTVADVFGDPEDNAGAINYAEFKYDTNVNFGEQFFEKIMYDIEVLAVILFCKLNNIKPIYASIPGCWWQPSGVIEKIIKTEGAEIIEIYPSQLESAEHSAPKERPL